tara:strand:+ start:1376 stop:4747 length:3372 start_codon:yes stop_codon:yes gene_type:complete
MGKFSDKLFGSNVDTKTIDIFNALQKGQYEFKPNESVTNLPEYSKYLGDKTTFARMWTAVATSGSDVENDIFFHIVNDNRSNFYEPNEPVGFNPFSESVIEEGTDNQYLKPNAGITSISSKTEGPLGAVKRTTVEFVVHNKNDFDNIYLPFFLRPGATVIVDFGWSDRNLPLYDISSVIKNNDTELKQFKKFIYDGAESGPDGELIFRNRDGKRIYKSKKDDGAVAFVTDDTNTTPPGYLYSHKGLVDTNIGIVQSYSSKIVNGSYQCSLELLSENASLLDNEISADNNLKFIFANRFEEILIQSLTNQDELLSEKNQKFDLLSKEEKQKRLNNFFSSLLLEKRLNEDENRDVPEGRTPYDTVFALGKISDIETKIGIYFETTGPNNQDTLYISFGLFNDLFLNSFVCKKQDTDVKYDINFKLRDYYVRFDANLNRRQTAILTGNDELPVFLYPKNWEYSRDAGKNDDCAPIHEQKTEQNPYNTPVIPLREVFISVPVIKQAFQRKQTVNDAINFILKSINDDSYGVIDLKMIAPNRSYSEIGIQDNNLLNPLPDISKMLTFDVTEGNGVVINMDYSFETPKGDLQNMLAISNSPDQTLFDVDKLDNLNFINIMKSKKFEGKDVFIKSLPFNEVIETPETITDTDIDVKPPKEHFKKTLESLGAVQDVASAWDNLVSVVKEQTDNIKNKKEKPKTDSVSSDDSQEKKRTKVLKATSRRDAWGKAAKKNNVLRSRTVKETISPILPINLTLTVYGNTFLNIGDIFTINFLPESYRPYLYFVITGVEQKLDTKWETTYTTQYRVRPSAKQIVYSETVEKIQVELDKSTVKAELNNGGTRDSTAAAVEHDKSTFVDIDDDLLWKGVLHTTNFSERNLDEDEKSYGSIGNVLDNELPFSEVNSLQHVKIAYGFTLTMLKYIRLLEENNPSKKVYYHIRTGASGKDAPVNDSNPESIWAGQYSGAEGRIQNSFDILFDVDVAKRPWTQAEFQTIKDIYWDSQKWGSEGTAKTMSKNMTKNNLIKDFIPTLTNGFKRNGGNNVFIYPKNTNINEKYAPIIARARFKLGDYGDKNTEPQQYFQLEDIGTPGLNVSNFISPLKIPMWFVNNDPNKFLRDLIMFVDMVDIPT